MDGIIDDFLDNYVSEELRLEIYKSFNLFELFDYKQAYSELFNILSLVNVISTDDVKDRFMVELHNKLNYVLSEHGILLNNETTLADKNEVLRALEAIQYLEDYTGIIRTLEGDEPIEVQFATIMEDISSLDQGKVLTMLVDISENTLKTLKQFIYLKEENEKDITVAPNEIQSNIELFVKLFGNNNLASKMLEAGSLIGAKFNLYIPFIHDDIIDSDNNVTAINLLSVFLISSDCYLNPLAAFKEYNSRFISDLNKVSAVETALLKLLSTFNEAKGHLNEQDRLFKAGGTV